MATNLGNGTIQSQQKNILTSFSVFQRIKSYGVEITFPFQQVNILLYGKNQMQKISVLPCAKWLGHHVEFQQKFFCIIMLIQKTSASTQPRNPSRYTSGFYHATPN